MNNNIDQAIEFARVAHQGMKRKGSDQPYIFHPLEVLSLVSTMTLDDDVLCAAVLHDTVEDTGLVIEDIRYVFGDHVADLVSSDTEDKRDHMSKEDSWRIRKQETIDVINNEKDLGAKMVCLGDKVSNLRSFHLGLLQYGEEFWNNFHQKDPLQHYWYYDELRKALSDLQEYAVYKEFCFLIDAVFDKYIKEK